MDHLCNYQLTINWQLFCIVAGYNFLASCIALIASYRVYQ